MNDRITIQIRPDMREALERLHREQEPPMASKQECYRHIIEDWLAGRGYLTLPPDGEDAMNTRPLKEAFLVAKLRVKIPSQFNGI